MASNPERFELRREIQKKYRSKLPKVDRRRLLRHIDHAVKVMGADHVGFGSDFDGISGMAPEGMEDVSKYPELIKGLIAARLPGRRHSQDRGSEYASSDARE